METTVIKNLKEADFEKINAMPLRARNQLVVDMQQATGVSPWAVLAWLRRGKIPHWHIDRVTEIINQALEQAEKAALEPQHQ